MTTNSRSRGYWEVLLRLPGTRSSDTASRWLNRAFTARGISASASPSDPNTTAFTRVRANTSYDLARAITLVTRDTDIAAGIHQDARFHLR